MKTVAFILVVLGAALSLTSWASLVTETRRGRRSSPVFPPPGLLTAVGLGSLPQTHAYWWVGLLMDYSFLALLIATPRMIRGAWRSSSFTQVQLLQAQDQTRRFELSLHRGGHFVLRATFEPPMRTAASGARVTAFGAPGDWHEEPGGQLRLSGYRGARILRLERCEGGYLAREAHYPPNDFPYDSLDGLTFRSL